MPYETDEKIKSYLDTNQMHREQMCRAILAIDRRFSDVRPRHPRGGPDGGRDIEAVYREDQIAFGAVGFVNQANDSEDQKKSIKAKFQSDLSSAISAEYKPSVFVFLTNINLSIGEKEELVNKAKMSGLLFCEIFDRERLRIALDSPDGFSIRFQYLNISLSEEEQASFFARWGDDIQSVISTGFQRIEETLNRVLFLQEATYPLVYFTLTVELDRKYKAEEIGHFRLFCSMHLKEPKYGVTSILFGSSDKCDRMRNDLDSDFTKQTTGIKYGISSGQWERHIKKSETQMTEAEDAQQNYNNVAWSSGIGMDEVEFLSISYNKDYLIRFFPYLIFREIDEAMFLPFANKSLAEKIKRIHIFSNGYKLLEKNVSEFHIDASEVDVSIPVFFSDEELVDQWVRVRPNSESAFHIRFFEETPRRMFVSAQTKNSLEKRNREPITKP